MQQNIVRKGSRIIFCEEIFQEKFFGNLHQKYNMSEKKVQYKTKLGTSWKFCLFFRKLRYAINFWNTAYVLFIPKFFGGLYCTFFSRFFRYFFSYKLMFSVIPLYCGVGHIEPCNFFVDLMHIIPIQRGTLFSIAKKVISLKQTC